MISANSFKHIMDERTTINTLSDGSCDVEVVYEVFKHTSKYISPELIKVCSKTALEIAYYISSNLKPNQTSIRIKPSDIVVSTDVRCKTPCGVRNAIQELVNAGAIIRWANIDNLPSNVHVDKFWYLLNPQMIKAIGCKIFKEQVNTTMRQIINSSSYYINEYSAIVYDFDKIKYVT